MFKGRDEGDTRPLLPLLLVTMATLPFPWSPPPPPPPPALPLLPMGGVGVVVEEAGCWSFFLLILRSFARRFWNQIFTWNRRNVVFMDRKKTCKTWKTFRITLCLQAALLNCFPSYVWWMLFRDNVLLNEWSCRSLGWIQVDTTTRDNSSSPDCGLGFRHQQDFG